MESLLTISELVAKLTGYADQGALAYLKYTMPIYPSNRDGELLWRENDVDRQLAHAQKLKDELDAASLSDDVVAQFFPVGRP